MFLALVAAVSLQATLTAAAQPIINAQQAVGAAVGVVRNGQLIYARGFGLRNIATQKAVDVNTRFEIGSVTKQFTAAAILRLKEQGTLALDDRLARYVPTFPHANAITIRQLLQQTTGLADYVEMTNFMNTMARVADALPKIEAYASAPLHFRPGTQFEYSSTNYVALGRVIEVVSHQSYEEYVRDHLFAPASMSHSGFIMDEHSMSDMATPYSYTEKGAQPAPRIHESWAGGAGAIVSTLGDMAAWDAALTSGKIVSRKDYALMSSESHPLNRSRTYYGMGLSLEPLDGHARVWHNGATNGSTAMNATYPNDRVDVIVFENSTGVNPGEIDRAIVEALFPDALAAARKPAKGEDVAMRPRVLRSLEEILTGTMQLSEVAPKFHRFLTPQRAKAIAAYFGKFGPPKVETFQGMQHDADGTSYDYRIEFAHAVRNCWIKLDANNLVSGIGISPPSS